MKPPSAERTSHLPQPLVTVLTPVYNGAAHLRECIASVLRQTYANWEYVIVNNRSTDETLAIAQEYAARDPRIRVMTSPEFIGVIANHNRAVAQMSRESKYCKFLHADDWLFPECLAAMVEVAEQHPSVGFVSAYRISGDKVTLDRLPYPSTFVCGRTIGRASLLEQVTVFGNPTSTLIRADVLRSDEKFYNESNLHADTEACYRILEAADFGFVHQVLTFTRRHPNSVTNLRANQLYTYAAARMYELHRFGPSFLSPEEYRAALAWYERRYYRILGRHYFRRHSAKLRHYHRTQLQLHGIPLKRAKLVWATLVETARLLLELPRLLDVVQQEGGVWFVKRRPRVKIGGRFENAPPRPPVRPPPRSLSAVETR